ncbi:transketolase [Thermodesulfobacteriota bacterium]
MRTTMIQRGFSKQQLDSTSVQQLQERARMARGDILAMTSLAGCGHPGGSMSSIEMYITLYGCANINPAEPRNADRDRIVISHGHTSPGAYAALGRTGFFNVDDAITGFRFPGSIYEGHVERCVPGIEWGTGNLGQGLSAACGFALAARIHNKSYRTFVVMGDGEQQKGQIAEARRLAVKYKLNDLTALIDYNQLQISGDIHDIMPQNIKEGFIADGWNVLEINGHDIPSIYEALYSALNDTSAPTLILANTVMGKGVSFMENVAKYHGVALNDEQFQNAMKELDLSVDLQSYREQRARLTAPSDNAVPSLTIAPKAVKTGTPVTYAADKKTDNRSAFGNALKDLAELNKNPDGADLAVFDCDLASSVKTNGFQAVLPDNFFEVGIQEHSTATVAGALSVEGIVTFFADFGVFGICETYNQHRLNDINHSNLKLVCTHVGFDVGEDGKTHQCIDYIGLMQNIFGYKTIIPADPNQTDRATRYITKTMGNFSLSMGRSKLPTICSEDGLPLFGDGYDFSYGSIDTVRPGSDATIITCGGMLYRALQAWDILKQKGISVRVLNISCPKDPDLDVLAEAAQTGLIITYEDHNVATGLGTIVADSLIAIGKAPRLIKLGVADYGFSGKPDDIFKAAGLDVDSLVAAVEKELSQK